MRVILLIRYCSVCGGAFEYDPRRFAGAMTTTRAVEVTLVLALVSLARTG